MTSDTAPSRTPATPETGPSLFPVGVVARHLDTKTATLRAWERRYGLGPSQRTPGGHRRYSPADLRRLERMSDLLQRGVAAAEAAYAVANEATTDSHSPTHLGADDLVAAMDAVDPLAVTRLAGTALDREGAQAAWTGVFAPALVAIGERWEETGCGVEIEHMTSGLIEAALRQHIALHTPRTDPPAPTLVLAAAPDEHHTLPLTALAATLAEHGRTSVLVGSLPAPYLIEAITRTRPEASVLWARAPEIADDQLLQEAAHCTTAPVYPAGPAWTATSTGAGPPAPVLKDLDQAVRTLTATVQTPTEAARPFPVTPAWTPNRSRAQRNPTNKSR